MNDKFNKDIAYGKTGEIKAYEYFKNNPNIRDIKDVSNNPHYQDLDIDYIITNKGVELWIEVKNDRKTDETGHIIYELTSNSNKGCLERSKADYVIYCTLTKMYYFKLESIRKYINRVHPKIYDMGDGATGYLLELSDLLRCGLIREVKNGTNR